MKLVELKRDEVFTNSLIVAEGAGIEHRAVIQLVKTYKDRIEKFGKVAFQMLPSPVKGSVQKVKICYLNEQQATFLISLMKNTEPVVDFKSELVDQFFKMRKFIFEKQSHAWQETRRIGKLTRRSETDALKDLVEYAKTQGSKNPDKLYMVYSKLANKVAGIANRDEAGIMQLNNLSVIENIILQLVRLGILENKNYKEIYQECKKRLEDYQRIAFLSA